MRPGYDDWGNADHLLADADRTALQEGAWTRASGECLCPICAKEYWRHPSVVGCLWLHRICTGWLVKL